MSNANGIITAPVSITDDVAKVLGVGSSDLGTLCKTEKINMWSKYAPMQHFKISELTESEWKAAAYGFKKLGFYRDVRPLPTGGDASPYRLTDFIGYNHNAKCGLAFKQNEYICDLLNESGKDGVTVSLYTDDSMITLKSFVDTLLKGKTLNFSAYTNGIYYNLSETFTSASTLTWTISRDKLLEIGVTDNGRVYAGITPEGESAEFGIVAVLKLTAKTNHSVTGWNYDMVIGNNTTDWKAASNYRSGVTSNYIDLDGGKNLYIYNIGIPSGAYNTTLLQMTWQGESDIQTIRVQLWHDGDAYWSGLTGGTWMVAAADIPVLHRGIFRSVNMCIVAKATDYTGTQRFVRVSDMLEINLNKKA